MDLCLIPAGSNTTRIGFRNRNQTFYFLHGNEYRDEVTELIISVDDKVATLRANSIIMEEKEVETESPSTTLTENMNINLAFSSSSEFPVPVQRVTKYPLLSRLYRATAACATEREDVKAAQRCVESRLREINAAAAARRTAHDLHVADIKLRKMARFAMEGKLLFTQPNDNNWRKRRTIKLTPINALLVTNGKAEEKTRTRTWYRQLPYYTQGAAGAWRKRRNALANIMINPMLTRN